MDILVAILFFVVGAPLINIAKWQLVKWLDSGPAHFTESKSAHKQSHIDEPDGKNNATELKKMISDEITKTPSIINTNELVVFIMEIIEHVSDPNSDNDLDFTKFGNENWIRWKNEFKDLLSTYQNIHDDKLWNQSAKTIFSMGNMFFENDGKLIDKFNKTLHVLDKIMHAGSDMKDNEKDVDLCLKVHYGNQVVSKMLWSSEPPCIRTNIYSKIPVPEKLSQFYYSTRLEKISRWIGLLSETISYYVDLVKDISILILFCNVTYQFWDSFSTFVEYLAFTLMLTIVIPEMLKASYFYANHKIFIDTKSQLTRSGKWVVACFMFGLAPLTPNIILYERFKISKKIFDKREALCILIRAEVRKREARSDSEKVQDLDKLEEIKIGLESYDKLQARRYKYFQLMATAKHLEASTETFYQYVSHLLIIIVSHMTIVYLNSSAHESLDQKEHLHRMFYDYPTGAFLLYFSVTRAFISLISTRVSIETERKNMYFGDNAKIFFGFHTLISICVKIFSVLVCFVPAMGLYGFATHRWMSEIRFSTENGCVNETMNATWNLITTQFQTTSYYNLDAYFASYLLFVIPITSLTLFILKAHLFPNSFGDRSIKMLPRQLMHIANCVIFPSITQDWDEDFSTMCAR